MSYTESDVNKPIVTAQEAPVGCLFPSRLAMTGILIDFIKQLFSNNNPKLHPQLDKLFTTDTIPTDPDKAISLVAVEDAYAFNPQVVGQRPAVFVRANEWTFPRLSIGEKNHSVVGEEVYTTVVDGSHTLIILNKTPAATELLAREVVSYVKHFGQTLVGDHHIGRWDVKNISPLAELEEQSENFVITINIEYTLTYSWKLEPVASRLLRDITFNTIMNH